MLARLSLIAVATLAMAGCAAGLNKARQTVTVAARVQMDIQDAVRAADFEVKSALIAKVEAGIMTADAAIAANDAWERKLAVVVKANRVLTDALKAAGHAIDTAEVVKQGDYEGAIKEVASALAALLQALADAGIHVKGLN